MVRVIVYAAIDWFIDLVFLTAKVVWITYVGLNVARLTGVI